MATSGVTPSRVLLYVEDEDAAAYLFETALHETQIQADYYRVSNGEEALAFLCKTGPYCEAPTPNLVLLDLNLPKVDGFQVLERMRADGAMQSIPVVVFTSSSRPEDRRKSLRMGAEDFVTKPASLDDFFETVQATCARLDV